jgi:hypothetical protein
MSSLTRYRRRPLALPAVIAGSSVLRGAHLSALVTGAVLAVVTSGSTSPEPASQADSLAWVEPGWMAEARQAEEEFERALAACMRDAGHPVEIHPGGAVLGLPGGTAAGDAFDLCAEQLHDDSPLSDEQLRLQYDRALDTRDCLLARGYTISEPPTLETWLEQQRNPGPGDWVPFHQAIRQMRGDSAAAEYAATYAACPQGGPAAFAFFDG